MLPATKYPNNSRSVSGTVNVSSSDSILRVNTSSLAATINLDSIPVDYWSTEYALYVYDESGNAVSNNITLVAGNNSAGTAQTVNGGSTLVISTNGVRAKITISSNNSYIVSLSNATAGGLTQAYTTIQDEGTSITQRSTMNFVGPGVSATDAGGKSIITIPGGYQTIQEEGVSIPQQSKMNFIGDWVTAADANIQQRSDITITGPILYVTKNLFSTSASYAPNSSGSKSILSGTLVVEWSAKSQLPIMNFDLTAGLWTVGSTQAGLYFINTRLVTRINATDVDNPDNGSGSNWISGPPPDGGFVAIGIKLTQVITGQIQLLASNKQWVTADISDINVDCTCGLYSLLAGDVIEVLILNKTNYNIAGFANNVGRPDCVVEFSAIKLR